MFLDNAAAHTSNYSLWNLYNQSVKIIFNCPNTPAFNVIETVFCDMKYTIRGKNETESKDLVQEAKEFLGGLDKKYMKKKMS